MDAAGGKAGPFDELPHPLREGRGEPGAAHVVGEYPIILRGALPCVPYLLPHAVLPAFVFQQDQDCRPGDLQIAVGVLGLWSIDIDALAGHIVGGLDNPDHPIIQVDILPAQAQQLRPAQAGEQIEDDGRPPLDRLVLEKLKHTLCVRLVQVPGLVAGIGRKLRVLRRIAGDDLPLDGLLQDGGNGAVVGADRGRGQGRGVAGDGEQGFDLQPGSGGDLRGRFLVDGPALYRLTDSLVSDTGFLCESGLGDMLLTDPFVQRGSGRGGSVLPDSLLLEIAVKGLNMQDG